MTPKGDPGQAATDPTRINVTTDIKSEHVGHVAVTSAHNAANECVVCGGVPRAPVAM
jgi:hypothetical protein